MKEREGSLLVLLSSCSCCWLTHYSPVPENRATERTTAPEDPPQLRQQDHRSVGTREKRTAGCWEASPSCAETATESGAKNETSASATQTMERSAEISSMEEKRVGLLPRGAPWGPRGVAVARTPAKAKSAAWWSMVVTRGMIVASRCLSPSLLKLP